MAGVWTARGGDGQLGKRKEVQLQVEEQPQGVPRLLLGLGWMLSAMKGRLTGCW